MGPCHHGSQKLHSLLLVPGSSPILALAMAGISEPAEGDSVSQINKYSDDTKVMTIIKFIQSRGGAVVRNGPILGKLLKLEW